MTNSKGSKKYTHAAFSDDLKALRDSMKNYHSKYNITDSFEKNSAIYLLIDGHGCIFNAPNKQHFLIREQLRPNAFYNAALPVASCPSFHIPELGTLCKCLQSKIGRTYDEKELDENTIHEIEDCNRDFLHIYKDKIDKVHFNLIAKDDEKVAYKRAYDVLDKSNTGFKKPYSEKKLFFDEPESGIHVLQVQTENKKDYFNILRNPLFSQNNINEEIPSLKVFGEDFIDGRKKAGDDRSILLSELIYMLRFILKFKRVYIFDYTCNGSCYGDVDDPNYWEENKDISSYVKSFTKSKVKSLTKSKVKSLTKSKPKNNKTPSKMDICASQNKDYNINTKRCIKKCNPDNEVRDNITQKCIKIKKEKGFRRTKKRTVPNRSRSKQLSAKSNKMKQCIDQNKDYNPNTNRCIKKCNPDNEFRNDITQKCMKIKK